MTPRLSPVWPAALSVATGAAMLVVTFSYIALYLFPLWPIGAWLAYRGINGAESGAVRGMAIAGLMLNGLGCALLVAGMLGYLIEVAL